MRVRRSQAGLMPAGVSRIDRMEGSTRLLATVKLANVALAMLWGFAVTFVFVRILPLDEFQAFLLLIAFSNFTISAEFGFTSIIYNRLRRHVLRAGAGEAAGDFRREEIGVLLIFLLGLTLASAVAIGIALLVGLIKSGMPLLFLLFFVFSCLNVVSLLAKRSLAALDQNLRFELIDLTKRSACTFLLIAVLFGMDVLLSVGLQFCVAVLTVAVALHRIHVGLGMTMRQWIALRVGGGHIRRHYLHDVRASILFTLSEISAYNLPYFTIALFTREAAPMLLFDFVFKMARTISMMIRALVESMLPKLTQAFHGGQSAVFHAALIRAIAVAVGLSLVAGVGLMLFGLTLAQALFDGKANITWFDMGLIAVLLLALSVICVSVYLQVALGRFALMLRQSLVLLAGAILSAPLAAACAPASDIAFGTLFLIFYTFGFVIVAVLHGLSLHRLTQQASAAA